MADELDSSKIDGLIAVGMSDATLGVSAANGFVMVGVSDANIAVSKIDAFIMVGPTTTISSNAVRVSMAVI